MDKVVGDDMETAIEAVGGLCFLPRDKDLWAGKYSIPSISTKSAITYSNKSYILIDTANGFHTAVRDTILRLQKEDPLLNIIAGNVGSVEGFKFLADLGVYAVRVGVGNGSVCSTSIATGIGSGNASLIRDIANSRHSETLIIADGGMKTSGDVAKALALGADLVMTGRMFAGCKESPGPVLKFRGELYKSYAGQASHAVKKSDKYIEGDDTLVPYCGTVQEVWSRLEDGIRSCMSYMNCKTIKELVYLPDENFRILSVAAKTERTIHANE
jgi:IMP dehydrogenase